MKFKRLVSLAVTGIITASLLVGCAGAPKGKAINSSDDLSGAKVGVQEGTTGDLFVSDNVKDAEVTRFKKAIDAAMDLKNGKLDAVVVDDLVAKNIVASNKDLKILDGTLTEEEYAIAVKKDNTELVGQINGILGELYKDGTIDTIYNAYMQNDENALAKLNAKEDPKGSEKLVMATNAEFAPFEFKDDSGKIVGYDIEIAKEIARKLGRELVINDINFDSLITALSSGKCDFVIAAMTVTDERKINVDFSNKYYNASQVIIVKAK